MKQNLVKNDRYEILGENGWENFNGVIKNYEGNFEVYKLTVNNKIDITCTPEHKFCLSNESIVELKNLKVGDIIKTLNGNLPITNIKKEKNRNTVYNIYNSDSHHIYTNALMNCQCDEFAFVRKTIAEDFWSANYPTISSSRDAKIIIISCVIGDTYVFTDKGIKQINDFVKPEIKGGYELNSYSILGKDKINNGNLFVNSGKSKTRIIESTSSKLEGSLNHKLWACKNGIYDWYKLSELEIGDYISIQYGMNLWGNNDDINFKFDSMEYTRNGKIINRKLQNCKQLKIDKITPDWAYLFGLYISEGNAYKNGLCISCGDDISGIFNRLNIKYTCNDNMHYVISSTAISELLKFIGFDISKHAPQKEIPKRLLEMSKENIISLLQGIFDGDGWSRKDKGTIGIGLSSEKLINQIRMILLNFGILTDYYVHKSIKEKCTGKVKSNSIQYRLSCGYNDSRKFYDTIGFKVNRKQNKKYFLPVEFKEAKIDVIPFANIILGNIKKELKEKYNVKIHKKDLRKHISRPKMLRIKEILKQYDNLKFFLENVSENIKWEKIKNIKESENDVFDFSLPDIKNDPWCHSIIYNGLIGHQTPNGMWNLFHKIYSEAEHCENTFIPLKFTWRDVPGRDKAWADEQRKNLGKVKFAQEQLVEFLGSTSTVIDPNVLEILISRIEEPKFTELNGKLLIYEKPTHDNTYVIGTDTAKGTGENYSVLQILKLISLKPLKFEQVAIYRSNTIDVYSFADVINRLSYYYNNAFIMCENNSEGSAIVNRIWWEHENPNLVNSGTKTVDLGVRANKTTKPKAVLLLKKLIEDGDLILKDKDTVKELSSYIEENGKYKGKDTNDDCVSALYWAVYIVEMGILEHYHINAMEEKIKESGDDSWGILSDIEIPEEDFRWLLDRDFF